MKARRAVAAFSLVENLIAIALVALVGISLTGMVVMAGKLARSARQDIAAAEILEAKLEALRTCSWNQLQTAGFVPTNFSFFNDTTFNGTITLQPLASSESYKTNLVEVIIQVDWQTDNRPRNLAVTSYISRYGFSAP